MKMKFFGLCLVAISLILPKVSEADVTISVVESGTDVLVTAEGTLNLTDAVFLGNVQANEIFIDPDSARVISGPAGFGSVGRYQIPQGPSAFGPGVGAKFADSGSGDRMGIVGDAITGSEIFVPVGYTSGDLLSSSMTFSNETIASLSLVEGTYVYSWGTGVNADSLTVQIGAPAIPEPGFGLLGLGVLVCFKRTRKSN